MLLSTLSLLLTTLLTLTCVFFFFNDTATTEIYTLSLHDALPISEPSSVATRARCRGPVPSLDQEAPSRRARDRKSTRLNSSHLVISYAVFCLKKKNNTQTQRHTSFYQSPTSTTNPDHRNDTATSS